MTTHPLVVMTTEPSACTRDPERPTSMTRGVPTRATSGFFFGESFR